MSNVATVIEVLREVISNKGLSTPQLETETPLDGSLGLDSLDYAEVVLRLEAVFGTDPFSNSQPPVIRTIGDLANAYAAGG